MCAANRQTWPSMTEYQEAMQIPKICFGEKGLRKGKPVLNKLGLPRPVSGQFACVYELESRGSRWAIKCFLRNIPDLHGRYAKIAGHLTTCTLPYFVTFDYLEDGIKIRGDFFPIVRMEWVDGLALNNYVEQNLSNASVLESLEQQWVKLVQDLQSVNIAHCDLQHGNVLVSKDGRLRLIDYDGMWVPSLDGEESHETGHPNYQSPLRTGRDFHAEIDQFAGDVILIALRALQTRPDLWSKYDNGDNMLFKRHDFAASNDAELFDDLRDLGDSEIDARLDILITACGCRPKRGPSRLFKPMKTRPAMPAPSGGGASSASGTAAVGAGSLPATQQTRPAPAPPKYPRARRNHRSTTAPAATQSTGSATQPAASSAPAPVAAATPMTRGQRLQRMARVALHLGLLVTVTVLAITELAAMFGGRGDGGTKIVGLSFAAAALLGARSLLLQVVRQADRHALTIPFFGLAAGTILLVILAELLGVGWESWTGNDLGQCALMLAILVAGSAGLALERLRATPPLDVRP